MTTHLPEHLQGTEYVIMGYVPQDYEWALENGQVFHVSEATTVFPSDVLAEARPAELVIHLEDWRGHYLRADWLQETGHLLESDQTVNRHNLDMEHGLADEVEATKQTAYEAAATYHAHAMGSHTQFGYATREAMEADYGSECNDECGCEWIDDVVEETERHLDRLGYVTEWGDGVGTFRVGRS